MNRLRDIHPRAEGRSQSSACHEMKYLLVMKILLFIFASVPLAAQHLSDRHSADRDSILTLIMRQQEEWNQGNLEGYMEGYAVSDSIRFASGGNVSRGWDNMLARYKKGYPDRTRMGHLTFSELDIQILSPAAALVFGRWELARAEDAPWGYFTLLFQKRGENWRIVHDHTSSSSEK